MPPQNPLTRLVQVSRGLSAFADELRQQTDVDPVNIRYWSRELEEIYNEILEMLGGRRGHSDSCG